MTALTPAARRTPVLPILGEGSSSDNGQQADLVWDELGPSTHRSALIAHRWKGRRALVITILFHMTVKADREDEWRELLDRLHQSTHAEDEGCISYEYYRRSDNPRDYVLFEQWRDADALAAHIARLHGLLGPPPAGGQLPAPLIVAGGRLPTAFLDLFERTHAVRYESAV